MRYAIALVALAVVAGLAWGQSPKAWDEAADDAVQWEGVGRRGVLVRSEGLRDIAALIRRVEALERQVAYLAWERRFSAAVGTRTAKVTESELAEARPRVGSWIGAWNHYENLAKQEAVREVGTCPPWPWALPATTATTGVER